LVVCCEQATVEVATLATEATGEHVDVQIDIQEATLEKLAREAGFFHGGLALLDRVCKSSTKRLV